MKKIIIIIFLAILLISVIFGVSSYLMTQNSREYEIEEVKQYNYFVLKQNDLFGVIDKKGNIIVEPQYDEIQIPNPEKAIFVCYNAEKTEVFNERKEQLFTQYDVVEPIRLTNIASDLMYEKSVLKYRKDNKYGLIDFTGKELTKNIYDQIDSLAYKEGELTVKQGDKIGVINIKGNKLVDIQYSKIEVDGYYTEQDKYKHAGYIVAEKTQEGYRYGYLDENGKTILKMEYNQLSRITQLEENKDIYMIGSKDGRYGVTKNDKELIKNDYQSIVYDSVNKVLVVEKSKKYGVCTMNGQLIVPVNYNQIDITGIYLYAQDEQGVTVYNSNGQQANIDINIAILNTANEKYKIRIDNTGGTKYGIISKDGRQLVEEKYNYIEYLYEDYFIVSNENSKLGVIDNKENVKIAIENDSIEKIQGTDIIQTTIGENRMTKLYSRDMVEFCQMENPTIEVKEEYIKVYNPTETKYFNKEGKELKNTEVYPNNKLFASKQDENGKWGFTDKNNNVVVEYKYDKATEFNEYGFASVSKDGKWGAINEQGEEVIESTYELKEETEQSFIGKYYKVKYGYGEIYYTDAK